jgi:methyl-accepting chemotaxis protein
VILALAVIGGISVTKMNALDGDAQTMANHDVVSIERVLTVQQRVQQAADLTTSHLYVHDGELAVEDGIAKQIAAIGAANARDFKTLDASIDDSAARTLLARYRAAVARFAAASGTAVRRSRTETVRNAEDRDGSRNSFQGTVLPAEKAATTAGTALRAEVGRNVEQAKARTNATAASGRTTIVIAAILATLAALGLAFLVVVSVVRPLKVVVERLGMLRDVCIAGLTDAVKAMATGDLTKTVEPKTPQIEDPAGDEVGDVARAFNEIQSKMVEAIGGYNETRFAVVAEEVRKLAEESQSAAGSIAGLIAEIQAETAKAVEVVEDGARQTEEGVATVEEARAAFLKLGESVQDMGTRVDEIAVAIQQIASSSQQVQGDMTEVAAVESGQAAPSTFPRRPPLVRAAVARRVTERPSVAHSMWHACGR